MQRQRKKTRDDVKWCTWKQERKRRKGKCRTEYVKEIERETEVRCTEKEKTRNDVRLIKKRE